MDSTPERMEDDEEYVPSSEEMEKSPPKKRNKRNVTTNKKKDSEFEAKKKVALQVKKFKNLYDSSDKKHFDKNLESTCWKKVSKETGLDVKTCMHQWESLKRSAKYYAREIKLPYKSGASADDPDVQKKYKDEWKYAEIMEFYTPPSIKKAAPVLSVYNRPSTSKGDDEIIQIDETSMQSIPSECESVNVSIF